MVEGDDTGRVDLNLLLQDLDDDRRAAFVYTQVLGMSYEDAAESLDCPIGTIRSRVARARLDLINMATSDEGQNSFDSTGTEGRRQTTWSS